MWCFQLLENRSLYEEQSIRDLFLNKPRVHDTRATRTLRMRWPAPLLVLVTLCALAASPGDAGRARAVVSAWQLCGSQGARHRPPEHRGSEDAAAEERACLGGATLPVGAAVGEATCQCHGPANSETRRIVSLHSWLRPARVGLVQQRSGCYLPATLRGGGADTPSPGAKGKKGRRVRSGADRRGRDRAIPSV